MPAELTLAAALRDVTAARHEARSVAVRNLAPALLDEIGLRPPVWWAQIEHARRDEVVAALERACDDPSAQIAALARVGLAELAAPPARGRADEALAWPEDEADEDAAIFMRECAVIALSLIGSSARRWLDSPASTGQPRERAQAEVDGITEVLRARLNDPHDDVRFQVGPALVEVASGPDTEADLVAALAREDHPRVRENLIAALSMFDPPGPAACDALSEVLATDEGQGAVGWEAAVALAGAGRPEAWSRLVEGLRSQRTRDLALEALAVIGPHIDEDERNVAAQAIRAKSRVLLVPVFTRVRAAYALARIDPEAGEVLLARLENHLRPAVREAVAEARENLKLLAERDAPPSDNPYRRGD